MISIRVIFQGPHKLAPHTRTTQTIGDKRLSAVVPRLLISLPKHIHCQVSITWIVFINRNSGRIRALSWFLIMTYQTTTIRMTTWLDTWRARGWTHEYLYTPTLGVLINNYCYGKFQVRITRDFLFVNLRKKLNPFFGEIKFHFDQV